MRDFSVVFASAALTVSISTGPPSAAELRAPDRLQLSKGEVKSLLRAAHTAEGFRLLSRYYGQEGERLEQRAREHHEEAEGYASRRVFEPEQASPAALLRTAGIYLPLTGKSESSKGCGHALRRVGQIRGQPQAKLQPQKEKQ